MCAIEVLIFVVCCMLVCSVLFCPAASLFMLLAFLTLCVDSVFVPFLVICFAVTVT